MTNSVRARRLALSIIDGEWTQPAVTDRLRRVLELHPQDIKQLAARLCFLYEQPPASFKRLATLLLNEPLLEYFWQHAAQQDIPGILLDTPQMQPPPANLRCFPLPRLDTLKDVALWLAVQPRELDWLADINGRQAQVVEPRLHHYRYRWVNKRSGGQRLIEIPKSQLKRIQRLILHDILDRILPHDAAHGFVRNRSCANSQPSLLGSPRPKRVSDLFGPRNPEYVPAQHPESAATVRKISGLCPASPWLSTCKSPLEKSARHFLPVCPR